MKKAEAESRELTTESTEESREFPAKAQRKELGKRQKSKVKRQKV